MGRRLALAVSWLSIIATLILLNELIRNNFDVDYVAHYSSRATPFIYKITALWAGQSGSLLFWLSILSVYAIILIVQNKRRNVSLMPWVILITVSVQAFFLILINFVTNPFAPVEANFVVTDGNGLNPLLQNITMAIHPPMLYLGYVGFTIPFAFAMAALLTKDVSPLWIRSIRRWTLLTWMFLSAGIILGGWWAYQELGWGGYWAWDPVENASLMPWLTGTAFIHSIIIQEKKNMLKIWNMILIIVTFVLVIFGTFMTRSGVMSSVHAFTASSLGPIFLGYVFLVLVVSSALLVTRVPLLRSSNRIESFSSRESGFLFNNVVFVVLCFVVLWGTLFPVLTEAVQGTKITVGAPFFNQVNVPIGLVLLFLTGVGPLLAWRRTSRQGLIKNFSLPLVGALVALLVAVPLGLRRFVLVNVVLSTFVLVAIVEEFTRGVAARRRRHQESVWQALVRLIGKNRTRYGGYIAHLGIVIMFIGFAGKAFDQEKEFGLQAGQSDHVGQYRFTLNQIREEERTNHYAWIADLRVTDRDGNFVTNLHPEKRIYNFRNPNPNARQPNSELDIYNMLNMDIYSVFSGVDTEKQIAYLKIMLTPLIRWVWVGGYILILGTLISLWPSRRVSA
ncbi:MAG: heme lyase CcmF/NrfE family subunit [Candidatus Neomarinimicrobiota bacterium]|nr:MAG: heme lyase CcmF/NrfE family subunit [Candidatus Neomarinimicrobiota bacterium]